jgi:hypothetical protein
MFKRFPEVIAKGLISSGKQWTPLFIPVVQYMCSVMPNYSSQIQHTITGGASVSKF